ncbi:hypothetical protein LTR05_008392 [Lithohypha guttulata]|uniref:Uncharacterized protein n=1 Tax=Lithohypha guttulata TaxID=1690604 RepID=A0AAN7Q7F1_9EURO|nr:hypothetical protein LTR05_008392 [Lithohypha guttulata]
MLLHTLSSTEQGAASKYRCIWCRSRTEDAKLDLLHYLVGSVLSWNQELRENLPWVLADVAMLPKEEGRKLLFEMAATAAFAEEEESQATERLCRSHAYQLCVDRKDFQPLLHVMRGGKVALKAFFAWVTTKRIEDYKVGDDIYALENRWTPHGETFEPDIPARMRSIEEEDIVKEVRQDHDEQVKNDGADRELVVMQTGDSSDLGRAHVGIRTRRSQSWSDFCKETGAILAEMIAVNGN